MLHCCPSLRKKNGKQDVKRASHFHHVPDTYPQFLILIPAIINQNGKYNTIPILKQSGHSHSYKSPTSDSHPKNKTPNRPLKFQQHIKKHYDKLLLVKNNLSCVIIHPTKNNLYVRYTHFSLSIIKIRCEKYGPSVWTGVASVLQCVFVLIRVPVSPVTTTKPCSSLSKGEERSSLPLKPNPLILR